MAQLVACSEEDSTITRAKEELKKAMEADELSLKVLKDGGIISHVNLDKPLPPASQAIAEKISETQNYFEGHKNWLAYLLINPNILSATTLLR